MLDVRCTMLDVAKNIGCKDLYDINLPDTIHCENDVSGN